MLGCVFDRERGVSPKSAAAGSGAADPRWALRAAASGSESLVHKLKLQRSLRGHRGCVNTVSFSPDGELLVSGSDDQNVIVWDWATGGWYARHANANIVGPK